MSHATPSAPPTGGCPFSRAASGVFGIATYLGFVAVFGLFVFFLGDLGGPFSVDRGPRSATLTAAAVDIALVLFFGVSHSLMARAPFKRWWIRRLPPHLERTFFVMWTCISLALLMWQWRPLPGVVWEAQAPVAVGVVNGVFWLGWAIVLCSTWLIDHFDLTGLRQVYLNWRGRPYEPPHFAEPFLYRIVRHPMMLGMMMALWAAPRMTAGRLLLAAAMTLYILVGVALEERDLVLALGPRYRDYQRRVPSLVPLSMVGRRRPGTGNPSTPRGGAA